MKSLAISSVTHLDDDRSITAITSEESGRASNSVATDFRYRTDV
jgi:hypothetical protein